MGRGKSLGLRSRAPLAREKPPESGGVHLETWSHLEPCTGLKDHLLRPRSRPGPLRPAPAATPTLGDLAAKTMHLEAPLPLAEACPSVAVPSWASSTQA